MKYLKVLAYSIAGALALVALTIAVLAGVAPWLDGPVHMIAGGPFQQSAEPDTTAGADPALLVATGTIELEVNLERRPSVNVAVLVLDGEIYVPATLNPEEKRWPRAILEDHNVRIRTRGQVHRYLATRVAAPDLHDRLAQMGAEKYSQGYFEPENTWFFHLTRPQPSAMSTGGNG